MARAADSDQRVRVELLRTGTLVYLIGGIALVLGVLWWALPGPETSINPAMGKLEARYRSEFQALLAVVGLREELTNCTYFPKSLTLACEIPSSLEEQLRSALSAGGWQSQPTRLMFAFTKERDIASLECHSETRAPCEFRLTYRLSASGA